AFLLIVLPRNGSARDLVSCDPAVAMLLSTGVILMSKPSRLKRMIAGALLGAAALFRHDFGMYGIVAATLVCLFQERSIVGRFRRQLLRAAQGLAWLFVGIGATAGIGYAVFAAQDFRALWTNLVVYPTVATDYRRTPFPLGAMSH